MKSSIDISQPMDPQKPKKLETQMQDEEIISQYFSKENSIICQSPQQQQQPLNNENIFPSELANNSQPIQIKSRKNSEVTEQKMSLKPVKSQSNLNSFRSKSNIKNSVLPEIKKGTSLMQALKSIKPQDLKAYYKKCKA